MKGADMYRIVGSRSVAGKAPGEVLSDEELQGCNLEALVQGGHLEAFVEAEPERVVEPKKAVKTVASAEADEADPEEN